MKQITGILVVVLTLSGCSSAPVTETAANPGALDAASAGWVCTPTGCFVPKQFDRKQFE